jgi:hypothetical protein
MHLDQDAAAYGWAVGAGETARVPWSQAQPWEGMMLHQDGFATPLAGGAGTRSNRDHG